jgi:hypothetical protein
MAVGYPLCHLQDFHGHPEILHTIQKPVYESALSPQASFISWKVSVADLPVLKQNLIFPPSIRTVTTTCMVQNLKHD